MGKCIVLSVNLSRLFVIYAIHGNVDLCYKSLINSMDILVCLRRLNVANKEKRFIRSLWKFPMFHDDVACSDRWV